MRRRSLWSLFLAGRMSRRSQRGLSHRAAEIAVLEALEPRVVMTATAAVIAQTAHQPVARIINGAQTSDYAAVGLIGDTNGDFCSGTLIAPQYVLTAGHCAQGVADTAGTFTVGGSTYHTEKVFLHQNFNINALGNNSANDIAIYKLNQAVVGITPFAIFRSTPHVGDLLTLVGFGGGGTGNTGSNGDFGIKRVGTTPIDSVTTKLIRWNFDNNTESNTAPGDSGGPAFETVGGVKYIAGVTSGGDSTTAAIGDHSFDTRVDAYAAWIDTIVGTGNPALPTISIVATDANAAETLSSQTVNTGTFTLTRTGVTTSALTVTMAIGGTATNGTDYKRLSATATFAAGQASTTLTVKPIDDTTAEPSESVIVTLSNTSTYNADSSKSNATVTIADNDTVLPTISLTANDPSAAETISGTTANRGQYTLARSGSTAAAVTVSFTVTGTATNGSDLVRLGTTATIPAGSSFVYINVIPIDDTLVEPSETVILTLSANSAYNVDATKSAATVTIDDNDVAVQSNDNFADRRVLTGSSVTVTGDNRSATSETNEPNIAGVSGGKSVWWSWTASTSGGVTITTAGSTFDTTLGVYTGSNVASLNLVTENDDQNGNAGITTSRVRFNAVAGTTYQILVDGYDGATGDITLKLTQQATAFAARRSVLDSLFTDFATLGV